MKLYVQGKKIVTDVVVFEEGKDAVLSYSHSIRT